MKSISNTLSRLALILAILCMGAFSAHAAGSVFSTAVPQPNGITTYQSLLLVTSSLNTSTIYSLSATGAILTQSDVPTDTGGFNGAPIMDQEMYLAVAPSSNGGWTAGDIYAVRGPYVWKVATGGALLTTLQIAAETPVTVCTGPDSAGGSVTGDHQHSGITFDQIGTFGYAMIVTCGEEGLLKSVTSAGVVSLFATMYPTITEGPAVVPAGFSDGNGGSLSGSQVFVTQESVDAIEYTSGGSYTVYPGTGTGPGGFLKDEESMHLVPASTCTFKSGGVDSGYAFFSVTFPAPNDSGVGTIWGYPASDFSGIGGNLLVPLEYPDANGHGLPLTENDAIGNIWMINKTTGAITQWDSTNLYGNNREGSSFVECVALSTPTIATSSTASVTLGTAITDTATLSGASTSPVAGGTITFKLYGPSASPVCTSAIYTSSAITVSGSGTYGSAANPTFTPGTAGTYYWIASYSGDANNSPIASTCGAETSVVTAPVGGTGFCSPGIWKTHPITYTANSSLTENTLLSTLGINFAGRKVGSPDGLAGTLFANITIADGLGLKGGGYNALTRSMLNAYLGSVVFGSHAEYSTADVISKADTAYAGNGTDPFTASENCLVNANGKLSF